MYCNQCGSGLPAGVMYCTHCGKAVGAAPVAAPGTGPAPMTANSAAGRVLRHRNVLGILWLVLGMLGLTGSAVLLGISGMHGRGFGGWDQWGGPWTGMPPFVGGILGGLGVGLLIFSVLRIIAGVGLLTLQSWARMLTIVVAIISLINIPFGTAVGIYTLWVLMPDESDREFAQLAQQRARGGS